MYYSQFHYGSILTELKQYPKTWKLLSQFHSDGDPSRYCVILIHTTMLHLQMGKDSLNSTMVQFLLQPFNPEIITELLSQFHNGSILTKLYNDV
jgi:hypothetical protein